MPPQRSQAARRAMPYMNTTLRESDEARFLRRLAEGPEMPPDTTEEEGAAPQAEYAGAVEAAAMV